MVRHALLYIVFFVAVQAKIGSDHNSPYWEQPFSQPYFDNTTRRDVTTTVGQTAHLHCRVRNLGDRAVCIIQLCLSIWKRNLPNKAGERAAAGLRRFDATDSTRGRFDAREILTRKLFGNGYHNQVALCYWKCVVFFLKCRFWRLAIIRTIYNLLTAAKHLSVQPHFKGYCFFEHGFYQCGSFYTVK